jgi:lipopolysaccharide/colanic/teichoic acid biosynthesis glycosyltransferase
VSVSAGTDAATRIRPRSTGAPRRVAKRTFDVVGATILLVVSAPLLLAIALLIRLDSSGPALFRQSRIGLRGRRFRVTKFRTMVVGAEAQTAALKAQSEDPDWLLLKHDPRITRMGRVLRAASLDELPQLWNVLRGEMSLVGPRPITEDDDAHVPRWAQIRNEVPPGITGLWQVSGRTDISFQQMLELDCQYVQRHTFWGDIALLVRTIPAVLFARGVN